VEDWKYKGTVQVRQSELVPLEQVVQVLSQMVQIFVEALAYVPSVQTETQADVEVFR